jgi:hypothetical protein
MVATLSPLMFNVRNAISVLGPRTTGLGSGFAIKCNRSVSLAFYAVTCIPPQPPPRLTARSEDTLEDAQGKSNMVLQKVLKKS